MKTTSLSVAFLLVALAPLGCANAPPDSLVPPRDPPKVSDDPTQSIPEQPGAYAGGKNNTFDHGAGLGEDGARDPFEVLTERQAEGPPEIRTRLHSCQKLQYATVRNILTSFGVDIEASGDPATAGQLWRQGGGALGVANYDARVGEAIVWSASGAAKLFDIFVQAAPEIIAAMPGVAQCQVDGVGPEMFDESDRCNADAVSCLIGRTASEDHIAICNHVVQAGSDIEIGKRVAVATLLSAAHSCE